MYHPYFRGKQYDLIVIRESAELLAKSKFIPIVEPVKETLKGLERAIQAVVDADGELILIVNPQNGDHIRKPQAIQDFMLNQLKDCKKIFAGILLTEEMQNSEITALCKIYSQKAIYFIHAGYSDGKVLSELIAGLDIESRHIFIDGQANKLYRRHFSGVERILVRDGFKKRANRLHPQIELFSDIHATYRDEGMDGFGDFLIVGDEYSETGGPAYAVAIHMTFIDPEKDDAMYIHHFKSDRYDTPTDPAGKFAEAVAKLVTEVERPNTNLKRTAAVRELIALHERGHFPGLGYIKKLSMQHHIETLSEYFLNENN